MKEEEYVKTIIEVLSTITSPLQINNGTHKGKPREFADILRYNLDAIKNSDQYKCLEINQGDEFFWNIPNLKNRYRWHFICTCLKLMSIIRDSFEKSQDDQLKLLSISQKKILESTLQFVVCLGLLPYLLPGVGVALEQKGENLKFIDHDNLKDFAKYKRLCFVIESILYLNEVDIFHEILISRHLEDILATLFQLSFVPIKKPTSFNSEYTAEINFSSLDDDFEIENMTPVIWSKLEKNKTKYQNILINFNNTLYQPLIIKKLFILLSPKKIPKWMRRSVVQMLTRCILKKYGFVAIVRALVKINSDSPNQYSDYVTIAKLILNICVQNEKHLENIASQLLKILEYDRKRIYEIIYIRVAALTVELLLSSNKELTNKYFLNKILVPLKTIQNSSEEEISSAVNKLYNLYIIPCNNTSALPIEILMPVSYILFSMHCLIKESVCYLKSAVNELLQKLICESEESALSVIINCLVLNEDSHQVIRIPSSYKFVFSSSGCVQLINEENECELESALTFLHLIKGIVNNERILNSFFIHLLRKFTKEIDSENYGEKRVLIVILLTELSKDTTTLKCILKNSENIIKFVHELLEIYSEKDNVDNSITVVCLTFLTMVLHDLRKKTDTNWKLFIPLLKPLEKLKKSQLMDVKILAKEVYNLIRTRSLIGRIDLSKEEGAFNGNLIEEINVLSICEKAIEDACDQLLPVRAHALMELISLVKIGDPETLAKKDAIMCLFQENMKDKDSFLYLRAIEGLSSIALVAPGTILPLLCEEFTTCTNAETRLKIGEVLLRTIKLLGDFVLVYKQLLLNTFLNGTKDDNNLVRVSSLSNLAEICSLLKFKVEDNIYEILQCATNIALYDKDNEPRRAACYLLKSLFCGLNTSMFKILEPFLSELYKTLKRICSSDEDGVVRKQAQNALNVLNDNVKELLTMKPSLRKKISILDHP